MRTLPHTDIPHTVEYLHGGPKPDSGLQQRYNKVVFKVSLRLLSALWFFWLGVKNNIGL